MRDPRRWLTIPAIVLILLGLSVTGGGRILAQNATATPSPTPGPAQAGTGRLPAALHQGTCQKPTPEPAFDLADLGPRAPKEGQTPPPEEIKGTLTGPPVLASTETADVKLDDLLDKAKPYVLIVHQSAENFQSYVACGELGGPVLDDNLIVGLRPLNNSGYAGTATLARDGDKTKVTTYLFGEVGALSGQAAKPPAAPPQTTPVPTIPPTPSPTPVTPAPTVPPTATATPTPTG